MVAASYERRLDRPRCAGPIFALKNLGWTDRREIESRTLVGKVDLNRLPDDLLQRVAKGGYTYVGTALVYDDSSKKRYVGGAVTVAPLGQSKLAVYFNNSATPLSSGSPMSWGNKDELMIHLTYTAK